LSLDGEYEANTKGEIELISPFIDPKTRTARVRVRVDNRSGTYVPGMFVRTRIFVGDAEKRVTVPLRAIITNADNLPAGKATVFAVRNSRVFRREVEQGQREGDHVVILSGLEPGEMIVLDAPAGMQDGTEVEILP
jgi:Cu(I)/Ag(I) efflux system membrane fusion protein